MTVYTHMYTYIWLVWLVYRYLSDMSQDQPRVIQGPTGNAIFCKMCFYQFMNTKKARSIIPEARSFVKNKGAPEVPPIRQKRVDDRFITRVLLSQLLKIWKSAIFGEVMWKILNILLFDLRGI